MSATRIAASRLVIALTLAWASPDMASANPNGDWPLFRGNPENQAVMKLTAEKSVPPQPWSFAGSGRTWGFKPGMTVWSSPAIGVHADRALLVVGSYDHNVYTLDAATGDRLWSFTTGDGVYSAPILWRGPTGLVVFATSSDRMLYALDAGEGRRLWIHSVADFRPTLGGAKLSSAAIGRVGDRAVVFFGHWIWDQSLTENQQESGITALDAETGALIWRRILGDNEVTAPIFFSGPKGGRLYLGSTDGSLVALDAENGETIWRRTELDAIRSAPALATSMMPAKLVMASKSGLIRSLDAESGQEIWRYQTGDWVTGSPAVATIKDRDLVFVGSYDRSLYALDLLSGALVWRAFTRGGIHASPAVVASEGQLVVLTSSWDHHLYALDARKGTVLGKRYTGRPLWDTVGLENSTWSSPVAAEINGAWTTFVGSYDGKLYAEPLRTLTSDAARPVRSNLDFWLSFPISLSIVALVALALTWQRRYRARTSVKPAASS